MEMKFVWMEWRSWLLLVFFSVALLTLLTALYCIASTSEISSSKNFSSWMESPSVDATNRSQNKGWSSFHSSFCILYLCNVIPSLPTLSSPPSKTVHKTTSGSFFTLPQKQQKMYLNWTDRKKLLLSFSPCAKDLCFLSLVRSFLSIAIEREEILLIYGRNFTTKIVVCCKEQNWTKILPFIQE